MKTVRLYEPAPDRPPRLWALEPLTEFDEQDREADGGIRTVYDGDNYMELTCGELVALIETLEPGSEQLRIAMNTYTLKDIIGYTRIEENPRSIPTTPVKVVIETTALSRLRKQLHR